METTDNTTRNNKTENMQTLGFPGWDKIEATHSWLIYANKVWRKIKRKVLKKDKFKKKKGLVIVKDNSKSI